MTWIAAAFLVVSFLVILQLLRVPARVAEISSVSRSALRTVRDPALSDADKEKAMRAGSLRLFVLFAIIALATLAALAAPAAVVGLAAAAGLVDFEAVLACTLSWQILLGATVVGVIVMRAMPRRQP
ncbi:MAG: hypothetical protein H6838_09890 [Planctomycetes bacterium]|nr:hypothetical protein [Planctomycetota bacterium]